MIENVRGALAFGPTDQLTYHLGLARTRLTEAEAMLAFGSERNMMALARALLEGEETRSA